MGMARSASVLVWLFSRHGGKISQIVPSSFTYASINMFEASCPHLPGVKTGPSEEVPAGPSGRAGGRGERGLSPGRREAAPGRGGWAAGGHRREVPTAVL